MVGRKDGDGRRESSYALVDLAGPLLKRLDEYRVSRVNAASGVLSCAAYLS
jgi:hypothetical protein